MGPGMLGKNRGGITSRPYPERPNITYPPPSYHCRPSRYDISSSFYHGTQKNAKVHEMMFRLGQFAYEQIRRSGAALLRQMKLEERIKFLERYPLSMDVTLNIEVPCEDHFDMIAHTGAWCQEDSIARIMNETGVLILFPCGRVEADGLFENVNTVKLKGPLVKVEEARRRLRDLCPISIAIPLKGLKSNMTVDQAREQIEVAIEDKRIDFPRIEIMIMQKAQDKSRDAWACVVRGSMSHEDEICEACVALYALLFEDGGVNKEQFPSVCTTSVDIPLPQQLSVLGIKGDLMLSLISSRTNAFVCHWNVSNRRSNETPLTIFYFKGTVRAIVRARKYIQGLLPVQLSFDVDDDDLVERIDRGQRGFTRRDDVFGVNITIKASRIEGEQLSEDDLMRHLVLIESEEHNLANVYATRRALFRANALDEPVVIPNDYDFFDPLVRQLALANSRLIFERQQGLEECSQLNPLPAAVCMPLSITGAAQPLDRWQAGSLGNVAIPMWAPAISQVGNPATCGSVSAMNSACCPLHSRGVIQSYVMGGMDPSIPSNNSSMYSGVSSVMPPSTDSSSRTAIHLPSNPPASTGIVAVAPPAVTAHHFISSVASSLSKQSNMPVGVSVAQFVDSFRTRGQTSQHSVHPTYITPATHLDAPQMIQANILHLSTVRLPQPELCCGTLPASMFPYTAEKPQPERGDGFELTSMGNSSLTNTDSEVTVTAHGMKPVMSVSPTPSGTSLLPNNRSSGSQGCTTEAVAAAMLSNVPLRWPSHPQSSTAESSNGCFGIAQQRAFGSRFPLPRFNQRQSPVLSTATNRGNANHSRRMMNTHFNNECRFAAKRILPLKPNFSGERLTADGSKSIQGNPSIDVHKEDVGLPSNVRLSPGGGLPQARVGDFHTSSLKSISQSQGIRDGRFSSHDYRNDSRDNRAGASRECRSDLHAQTRDFRGYKNEMHEFSIESHGSRNESHGSRVLRKISRDLRGEGRDCMNGLKDWAREPCGLRDELKGTSFGRQSPRGVMPLSYAVANGRDISAWSRSFHHDFPPPSVDSSAFRRDGFQKTPTFLFSRGFRRGMKDGSSRGDANRFCQPRNVTLSSTVHFGACASTRVDDASSMECALAAGHGVNPRLFDVRGSFSSAPASCRNNRDVLQMQEEHIPNRAEVNNRRERSDVENATSPEEKEPSTLPERLVENESEQGRDDSTQAFITTSSLTVGATAMKTYADIAKCVDAVKVVDAVCCHENNQAMKSKESTSDAARSANCIEKSVENTKHLKSYAEMTKKSVEKYSDATSSAARLLDPSESPNSRSSGSEIGSIKEKIEWTLANFDDVHKVLSRIGCQHLVPLFNARNIQMRDFCALSEDDLMRLGIKSSSERSRIHRAILRLRFAQHK